MQLLPMFFLRRRLFGSEDQQDNPRGLFDLFGSEDEAEPPEEYGVDREKEARWATDPAFQDVRLEELRHRLALPDPDPETRAFLRQLGAAGDIATGSAATATNFGPWAFRGFGGPMRFGPRPGSGTTIVPQTGPGPLVGAPQAKRAESQTYGSSRLDDAEAEPLPGSGFLFGGPQAGTLENDGSQVYHLPPADDGSDEESEDSPEEKAIKEQAAARAKENWDALCLREWDRDKRRCEDQFSYSRAALGRCTRQARKIYLACVADKDTNARRWNDDQENGNWHQETPDEKRRKKWKRPRSSQGD